MLTSLGVGLPQLQPELYCSLVSDYMAIGVFGKHGIKIISQDPDFHSASRPGKGHPDLCPCSCASLGMLLMPELHHVFTPYVSDGIRTSFFGDANEEKTAGKWGKMVPGTCPLMLALCANISFA